MLGFWENTTLLASGISRARWGAGQRACGSSAPLGHTSLPRGPRALLFPFLPGTPLLGAELGLESDLESASVPRPVRGSLVTSPSRIHASPHRILCSNGV